MQSRKNLTINLKVWQIMKINIKKSYQYPEPITVQVGYYEDNNFVLEFCNHAGADVLEVDFGHSDPYMCDYQDDWQESLVCDKCNSVERLI